MDKERKLQCKKISEITDKVTDKAIAHYDEGEMVAFWDTINALDILLDVEAGICELE